MYSGIVLNKVVIYTTVQFFYGRYVEINTTPKGKDIYIEHELGGLKWFWVKTWADDHQKVSCKYPDQRNWNPASKYCGKEDVLRFKNTWYMKPEICYYPADDKFEGMDWNKLATGTRSNYHLGGQKVVMMGPMLPTTLSSDVSITVNYHLKNSYYYYFTLHGKRVFADQDCPVKKDVTAAVASYVPRPVSVTIPPKNYEPDYVNKPSYEYKVPVTAEEKSVSVLNPLLSSDAN